MTCPPHNIEENTSLRGMVINMRRFADLVEKYLIRTIIISLVLLVLVQGLMTKDTWRFYLSFGERLEGQVIEYPVNTTDEDAESNAPVESPYAILVISTENNLALPKAKVLVNNKELANFTQNEVQLNLMAGDIVEIDTTSYNFPVEFKITQVSDNISFPERDKSYTANQGLVMIGKIIVK